MNKIFKRIDSLYDRLSTTADLIHKKYLLPQNGLGQKYQKMHYLHKRGRIGSNRTEHVIEVEVRRVLEKFGRQL